MIKQILKATSLCLLICSSAFAAPIVLTFEGVGNSAEILNFYNGGTDSAGNSGANYGIAFGRNSLGIVESKIQKKNIESNNVLLSSIIEQTEILTFEELLPSMNDIFIETVRK